MSSGVATFPFEEVAMTVRIKPVKFEDATPRQREVLEEIRSSLGKVPNLYATFAHAPNVVGALLAFQSALSEGGLSARDRDLIDLHVSQLNGCAYCVSAHTVLAAANKLSGAEILRIRDGQGESPRDSAILALARRVAKSGGLGAGAEIAQAREAGLSDSEIVEVIAATGLRSLVNAVGLAAGTEIDWPKPPRIPEP
jgi:uncharacterized peroxidase-related enzyme